MIRPVLALACSFSLGCGAGMPTETARPSQTSAEEALGLDDVRTKCHEIDGYGEPLVVDWDTKRRLDLELAMRRGIAVVQYDCRRLELLPDCRVEGGYRFAGVSRKEDVVQLKGRDEIEANLPFSGSQLGARLATHDSLDLALVRVGKKATTIAELPESALQGRCDGATHFVRGATVGAFAMARGTVGEVRAVAQMFGLGTAGEHRRERSSDVRDGDLASCRTSDPEAEAPPDECQSAIRLELVPFTEGAVAEADEKAGGLEATENSCPEGFRSSGLACVPEGEDLPQLCQPGDEADCRHQCDRGHAESCFNLGVIAYQGLVLKHATTRPQEAEMQRVLAVMERACDAGSLKGCRSAGFVYGQCPVEPTKAPCTPRDRDKARARYQKACDGGLAVACSGLASKLEDGQLGTPDAGQALNLYRRACDLGEGYSCMVAGRRLIEGRGVTRDVLAGLAIWRRSCDAGSLLTCRELADAYDRPDLMKPEPKRTAELLERLCAVDYGASCHDLAEFYDHDHPGLPKKPTRARALWGGLCRGELGRGTRGTGYVARVCARHGEMLRDGVGGPPDPARALHAYAKACADWPRTCGHAAALGAQQSEVWAERGCREGDASACEVLQKRAPKKAKQLRAEICLEEPRAPLCR